MGFRQSGETVMVFGGGGASCSAVSVSTCNTKERVVIMFRLFQVLAVIAFLQPAWAGTFFLRPGAAGNGTSWANAWGDFGSVNWPAVSPGSTVCIAGGIYNQTLAPAASGVSGAPITVKRALAVDTTCGSSTTGWSPAYDAQVVMNGQIQIGVNYFTVDGMVANGIQLVMNSSVNGYQGVKWTASTNYVTLRNLEIAGPNGTTAGPQNGDQTSIYLGAWSGSVWYPQTNTTIQYVNSHGPSQNMVIENASSLLIEHCRFADAAATNGPHANVIQTAQSTNVTFRYNEVVNWQVEGIMFLNPSLNVANAASNWYIYGNIWHDGMAVATPAYPRVLTVQDTTQGPFYVYNNTFVNLWIPVLTEGGSWAPGTVGRNNIYWNLVGIYCGLPDNDYDLVDTNTLSNGACPTESHLQTVSYGSSPFVSTSGQNYHLSSGTTAGLVLPAPYNIDYDGHIRGADGTWDRGAYEFDARPNPPTGLSTVVH